MATTNNACVIEHRPQRRALEFAAYGWPQSDGGEKAGWPSGAGAVVRGPDDDAMLLHFAPGRVLAADPSAATEALFNAAVSQGAGTCIDVSGKWERYSVRGSGAARLLACTIGLDAVLEQRECCALALFDCPAIVARGRDGFELWVQSSYARDFLATAEDFRATLQRTQQAP